MTNDHRNCDDSFVEFENSIEEANWPELAQKLDLFVQKLNRHFEMEESVIFPAFESATGIEDGPTSVMRSEHEQIRALLSEVKVAVEKTDEDECYAIAETLMMMMQQHNMKEEQMLYPMTDQQTDSQELIRTMQAIE